MIPFATEIQFTLTYKSCTILVLILIGILFLYFRNFRRWDRWGRMSLVIGQDWRDHVWIICGLLAAVLMIFARG